MEHGLSSSWESKPDQIRPKRSNLSHEFQKIMKSLTFMISSKYHRLIMQYIFVVNLFGDTNVKLEINLPFGMRDVYSLWKRWEYEKRSWFET